MNTMFWTANQLLVARSGLINGFITSVCAINTVAATSTADGSPTSIERAASFFHGHFEGLVMNHFMRVTDICPTQPESLNAITGSDDDSCVQGIGAHGCCLPGGPPSGGHMRVHMTIRQGQLL